MGSQVKVSLSEVVSGMETADQYQTNTYFTVRPLDVLPCPRPVAVLDNGEGAVHSLCCKGMRLDGTAEAAQKLWHRHANWALGRHRWALPV